MKNQIESTIQDIAYLDNVAGRTTWVYKLDPRSKIIVTFGLIFAITSFPAITVIPLLAFFAYPIIMIISNQIPLRIFRKPIIFALIFGGLIGIANPIIDKNTFHITKELVISRGWLSFISILLRSILCVTASIILIATTGMERLCEGLNKLGVPKVLTAQILFLYRYIFLLGQNALSMTRARALRGCGKKLGVKVYGSLIGNLLLRTFSRAEDIYRAMLCRGFVGNIPVSGNHKISFYDFLFVIFWFGFIVLWRFYNSIFHIGNLFF